MYIYSRIVHINSSRISVKFSKITRSRINMKFSEINDKTGMMKGYLVVIIKILDYIEIYNLHSSAILVHY